jgi:hypothetical protein
VKVSGLRLDYLRRFDVPGLSGSGVVSLDSSPRISGPESLRLVI